MQGPRGLRLRVRCGDGRAEASQARWAALFHQATGVPTSCERRGCCDTTEVSRGHRWGDQKRHPSTSGGARMGEGPSRRCLTSPWEEERPGPTSLTPEGSSNLSEEPHRPSALTPAGAQDTEQPTGHISHKNFQKETDTKPRKVVAPRLLNLNTK